MTDVRSMLGGALLAALLVSARPASAELTIEDDAAVPDFTVELEPHGVLMPFPPPGGGADAGVGAGLSVGINLAPRGFIPTVADSVSLGLGFDWVRHFGGNAAVGPCAEWRGSGDERICVRVHGAGGAGSYFYAPVVMQWSFYLTEEWSVFGEPGLAMHFFSPEYATGLRAGVIPVFSVGGRWHFSQSVSLTMRTGYPFTTVGLSLFL